MTDVVTAPFSDYATSVAEALDAVGAGDVLLRIAQDGVVEVQGGGELAVRSRRVDAGGQSRPELHLRRPNRGRLPCTLLCSMLVGNLTAHSD